MSLDLAACVEEIIDGHAHPCVDRPAIVRRDFAFSFSESHDPQQLACHTPQTVTVQAAIRFLAERLGVEATAEALIDYRNQHGLTKYSRQLLAPERLHCILLDTGYPDDGLSITASQETLGVACRELVRVESLAESLLPKMGTAEELLSELERSLAMVDRQQVAGFKTIAAYRCGLDLGSPPSHDVSSAFAQEKRRWEMTGVVRLSERALIAAIMETTLRVARELQLPLQVHTGFGDRDLDLRQSDPLLLRPLFESQAFADVPIVVLHSGYPFVRHAGVLAGLYPNAFVDLSLAIPLTAHGGKEVVLQLLEQAPSSKLSYGSDASVGPELFAWGAEVGKRAVSSALEELVEQSWMTCDEAQKAMRRIFAENAKSLYGQSLTGL